MTNAVIVSGLYKTVNEMYQLPCSSHTHTDTHARMHAHAHTHTHTHRVVRVTSAIDYRVDHGSSQLNTKTASTIAAYQLYTYVECF